MQIYKKKAQFVWRAEGTVHKKRDKIHLSYSWRSHSVEFNNKNAI